jgi:siroheme decarboxylase
MNEMDKKILDALQNDFPIAAEPYKVIAGKLDMSVGHLLERIRSLMDNGTIRRIGISIDSRKLGFVSTLSAIRINEMQIEKACDIINSLPEITHSYLRSDEYNIWFTIIARDAERLNQILGHIKTEMSLTDSDVLNLPVEKMFKLDARFTPKK